LTSQAQLRMCWLCSFIRWCIHGVATASTMIHPYVLASILTPTIPHYSVPLSFDGRKNPLFGCKLNQGAIRSAMFQLIKSPPHQANSYSMLNLSQTRICFFDTQRVFGFLRHRRTNTKFKLTGH